MKTVAAVFAFCTVLHFPVPDSWKFTIAEPPAASQPDWYLVAFTADNCGPCQAWKRDHLAATREVLPVVMVDLAKAPEWKRSRQLAAPPGGRATIPGVTRIPTFWLVHAASRWPVKTWTGGRSAEQARRLIPEDVPEWTRDTEAAPPLPE